MRELFFARSEGVTAKQIQDETGCSEYAVRVTLSRLEKEGEATRIPGVTSEGRSKTGRRGRPATTWAPVRAVER
ncbi:MAG: HTH domain-containing protein, partial [Sandaracinaceae bacterium]